MSEENIKEESSGLKDRIIGNVKDAAGAVTGDRSLEKEGEAQAAYGSARQKSTSVVNDVKGGHGTMSEEADAIKDRVVGNVKDAVGYITDDEKLQKEGKAQSEYGKARQQKNDIV